MNPYIAIVGAGPAGLLLAYTLQQSSIPFIIFEARSKETHLSQQGGSLDFHAKTGLLALQGAGLSTTILPHCRTKGTGVTLSDNNLKVWFAWPGGPSKPEIDRAELVALLLSSLLADSIKWSHPISSVTPGYLHFTTPNSSNITSAGPFTLIVGCDGAWSRVRKDLSDVTPQPTGIVGQRFTVPDASKSSNAFIRGLAEGSGARFAFSNHTAMILHCLADDRASITLFQAETTPHTAKNPPSASTSSSSSPSLNKPPTIPEKSPLRPPSPPFPNQPNTPTPALNPLTTAANLAATSYATYHPSLRTTLVTLPATTTVQSWNLHSLPIGFTWPHQPGITLIGDAAHVMPPFGGEGVNLALLDAYSLGRTIISAVTHNKHLTPNQERNNSKIRSIQEGDALDTAIHTFERDLQSRSKRGQQLSHNLMRLMLFEDDVPRSVVAKWLMVRAWYETEPRKWWYMKWVTGGVVHGFYGALKIFR